MRAAVLPSSCRGTSATLLFVALHVGQAYLLVLQPLPSREDDLPAVQVVGRLVIPKRTHLHASG